jgi:hypothetical protein
LGYREVFVIDDKSPGEYVKAIIKDHPDIIPEEKILNAMLFLYLYIKKSKQATLRVRLFTFLIYC